MAPEKFSHVISLGQTCETAYQVKRYFHINESNFFDFKRTSLECLANLITNDFRDVLLPENLSLTQSGEHIRDERYNYLMKHDFRNEHDMIPEDFLELYPAVKAKFDHLIGKFRKVLDSNDTCLFVYARSRPGSRKYPDFRAALDLEAALKNRAPGLKPKILYIDVFDNQEHVDFGDFSKAVPYDEESEKSDIFFQNIRLADQKERWKGSDLTWNQLFEGYGKTPEKLKWPYGYYSQALKHIMNLKARLMLKSTN